MVAADDATIPVTAVKARLHNDAFIWGISNVKPPWLIEDTYLYISTLTFTSPLQNIPPQYDTNITHDGKTLWANEYHDTSYSVMDVYVSKDLGATWAMGQLAVNPAGSMYPYFKVICSSSDGIHVLVVTSEHAYVSNDGGNNYTITELSGSPDLVYGACSDNGKVMAVVGLGGGIKLSTDYGITWNESNPTGEFVNWSMVAVSNDGSIIAASVYSGESPDTKGAYISFDAGVTWEAQNV